MIVVDIETTGLNPARAAIASIGAAHLNSDKTFYGECWVPTNADISAKALEVNGFTKAQLHDFKKDAPNTLLYKFIDWAQTVENTSEKIVLAGHNIGHFDILFLEAAFTLQNGSLYGFPFSFRTVDSHTLGYVKFKQSLSLDKLLSALGLPEEAKPHNALNGALACKSAIKKILG